MGSFRRLIRSGLLCSGVLLGTSCTLLACSEPEAVQEQRALLTPPDQAALQREKNAKTALTNEEGELLPSDIVLGGFPVPRGFELKRSYDNEWYLRSLEVSAKRTASYIEKRLFTSSIVRSSVGGFRFEGAQLREAPNLPKLTVRVSPTKNLPNACELYIKSYGAPKVEKLTIEQAEAKVREGAKYAD
jgi:hypothetical protein